MRPITALLFLTCAAAYAADETVGWLGDGSSFYPAATAPLTWDLKVGNNIAWRSDLGSRSHSGIIIVGDKAGAGRLFTQADPYYIVCLDAKSGKELWRQSYSMLDLLPDGGRKTHDDALLQSTKNYDAGKGYRGKELGDLGKVGIKIDGRTDWMGCYTFTRATPASNGKVVVTRNLCGGFACFDLDGKVLWTKPAVGMSSSPIIVGDRVIMAHRGLAKDKPINVRWAGKVQISAFDLKTGKKLWDCPIATRGDVIHGTPQLMTLANGRQVIATAGGQIIDSKTGENLVSILDSTAKKHGHVVLGSPAVVGDILILQPKITKELYDSVQDVKWNGRYGKNDPGSMYAGYRVEEKGSTVIATELWKVAHIHKYDATFSSSAVFDGKALFLNKAGHIRIFDPETGACDYRVSPNGPEVRKPKPYVTAPGHGMWVAPAVTKNGFYFFNRYGEWATYDRKLTPAGKGKLMLMAGAPTFAGKRMFVRSGSEVICIDK